MANAIATTKEATPTGKKRKRRRMLGEDITPAKKSSGAMMALRQKAAQEKHSLIAIGSAAALGLAERQNIKLPAVPMLGPAGTYGLAAYVGGRVLKNKTLEHVATGLLSVAAYKLTSGAQAAGSAVVGEDDIEGEDDEVVVGGL